MAPDHRPACEVYFFHSVFLASFNNGPNAYLLYQPSALSPHPSALLPLIPARPCGSFHAMAPTPSQATLPEAGSSPAVEPSRVAEFEHSLDELEQLVQRMEHGDLSLDDSLKTYERGIALYRNCQTALEQAELRVKLLYDPESPDEAEDFKPDTP